MSKIKSVAPGDQVEDFVNRLIEDKQFGNLDPDVLVEIKKDLHDRVEDHINAGILANVPADNMSEFERLLESGSADEITDFCRKHIPNLESEIATVLLNFRNSYLGVQ